MNPSRRLSLFPRFPALLVIAVGLMTSPALAQPQPEPVPTTFRTFAAGPFLSELFYEYQGKPVPVSAGNLFSRPYNVPEGGRVALYRLVPDAAPAKPPTRVPVTTMTIKQGGPYFVFLLATYNPTDPKRPFVEALVVDDSWEQHPAETIRVINFSQVRIAVKISDSVFELATKEHRVCPYPKGQSGKIRVQAAAKMGDEKWEARIGGLKQFKAGARSTFVISDEMPAGDDAPSSGQGWTQPVAGNLTLRNLIDTTPPPPKP